jgi:NAD(P)-dependent dehydrogenase (short-subunit alcohol dehydrogenase family)
MGALDGKVAIVTGATSGIGERIAEMFVAQGAKVVATGRRGSEGKALEERVGSNCSFFRADVSNEAEVKALIDYTVKAFGNLDVIVNDAGRSAQVSPIAELDMTHFDEVLGINLRGVVMCTKYAAQVMLHNGKGSIINISSVAGSRAGFTGHPYGTSKGAVLAFTRSVSNELGEKGIRVNSISPGGIVTGIFAKNAGVEGSQAKKIEGAVRGVFATFQPLAQSGETDDIANAAVFLASDAAAFVNGHDMVVDGGLSARAFGWTQGLELRGELGRRMKDAIA